MMGHKSNFLQFLISMISFTVFQIEICLSQDEVGYITAQPENSRSLFQSNVIKLRVEPPEATCGMKGIEKLCDVKTPFDCLSCTDELPSTSYPPELMLDQDTTTFWQSTYWEDYPLPFDINVTLSFRKLFQMEGDMTFRFTDGHLPSQAALEKSTDFGQSWEVFQYFSTNCMGDFNLPPIVPRNIENVTQVICTDPGIYVRDGFLKFELFPRYRLLSSDDGSFVNQLNLLFEEDAVFRNFFSFTDIRVHLMRPYEAENIVGQIASDRYHYSIQDIFFFSSCHCNLHGDYCFLDDKGEVVCNCSHSTGGTSCEMCKGDFQQSPWQPASFFPFPDGSSNECTEDAGVYELPSLVTWVTETVPAEPPRLPDQSFCEVQPNPCGDNGDCIPVVSSIGYRCHCLPGYKGVHCELYSDNIEFVNMTSIGPTLLTILDTTTAASSSYTNAATCQLATLIERRYLSATLLVLIMTCSWII